MSVCLFLVFRTRSSGDAIGASEIAQLEHFLQSTRAIRHALVHLAAPRADDPYRDDATPPALVLQLYHDDLPSLEAALARMGPLQALASREEFPGLAASDVTQQAMLVRAFPVEEPRIETGPNDSYCTYLVAYEGEATDLNLWLEHYLSRHPAHMARFPGIRELEVYTRLDWVGFLPWLRVAALQRNKVAFDSLAALNAALRSPIRHAMRADFKAFPPFTGPVTHHAMTTRVVVAPR